jgi:hypothetical protein
MGRPELFTNGADMACKLEVDSSGECDFLATVGSKVTICFQSDSGVLRLVSANYDKKPLTVSADSCVSFTVLSGAKTLSCVFVSPNPAEPMQVSGSCDGGSKQDLGSFPFQPVNDFVICGS